VCKLPVGATSNEVGGVTLSIASAVVMRSEELRGACCAIVCLVGWQLFASCTLDGPADPASQ